ncbi:MAG: N-acetyltransferase family protein [Bacteriovoracia bacterium]
MSRPPLQIRPLRADDAIAVSELAARCFATAYHGLLDPDEIETRIRSAYQPAQFAAEIEDSRHRFYGAWQGERLIAYLYLRQGYLAPVAGVDPALHLFRIYVDADAQGCGAGRQLMRQAEMDARAQGLARIWLCCLETNVAAIRFYEKLGYARVGYSPFRITTKDRVDIVFVKTL